MTFKYQKVSNVSEHDSPLRCKNSSPIIKISHYDEDKHVKTDIYPISHFLDRCYIFTYNTTPLEVIEILLDFRLFTLLNASRDGFFISILSVLLQKLIKNYFN